MPRTAIQTLCTLLLTLAFLAWLEQDAVGLYWRQVHHEDAPIDGLKHVPLWTSGARLNEALSGAKLRLLGEIARFDEYAVASFNAGRFAGVDTPGEEGGAEVPSRLAKIDPLSPPATRAPVFPAEDVSGLPAGSSTESGEVKKNADLPGARVSLGKVDSVLFVGDSLMQGVAPHVHASLYKHYEIRSLNLSRQSTGLAYPDFFDWPKQIKETFHEAPEIKLMIVFLGPNDPWDFPHRKGKPYLKFKSEDWESVYRARIREVIEIARENGARVFWLEVPCMREKELDTSMTYLNRLFADEVEKSGEFFLPTGRILGCDEGQFSSFMNSNGKKKKSRIDDGVHFTIAGQKRIADEILSLIRLTQEHAAR
ncbi:MAG: DUF459 domain-containing protein [Candidatus Accumulibacter sp.]|jgi:hypothetical protein|nr:DUF459 domain-containing protein [Accumulibacter sp.]